MTDEERRREICEIVKLADKVAALSHYRIGNVNGIRVVMAAFERWSEQVEAIEDGREGLAGWMPATSSSSSYGLDGESVTVKIVGGEKRAAGG